LDVREGKHEPCLTAEESDRNCDGNTPQARGFQGFSSNTTQRSTSSDRFGLIRFGLKLEIPKRLFQAKCMVTMVLRPPIKMLPPLLKQMYAACAERSGDIKG
jgi:hypothetical protein